MTVAPEKVLRYDPNARYAVRHHDFEYRRAGDKPLMVRVYEPVGEGPFPSLLDVHGGAWAAQGHLNNEVSQQALAESGLVVAAVDFRNSTDAPHPAAMEDINYAVRWLKLHAPEYHGSSDLVGGVGWSSGGHQVMLHAMKPSAWGDIALPEAPGLDATLAYVIMGWPVIDPVARYNLAREKGDEALMKRHLAYFGDEAGQEAHNPQYILDRGESVELPPALLVQGAADEALTRMMAERFVESYSLAGGVIELGKYPGAAHGFLREGGPNQQRGWGLIKSFIARYLEELQS